MGLQAQPAAVAVGPQRCDLAFPIHRTRTQGSPHGLVPFHVAILQVHVNNPVFRQMRIAFGKRILTGTERIGRIPDQLEVGMNQRIQQASRFGRRRNIAGVLILKPDDQVSLGRLLAQPRQRLDDPGKTLVRLHGTPVREHADDLGAHHLGDVEGLFGQIGLIGKGVFGRENIVLEAAVDFRSAG